MRLSANERLTNFDNSFSMRALTAQGPDSEGGFTVDDNVVDDSIFDNFYQDSYFLSNSHNPRQPEVEHLSDFKINAPISISTGGVVRNDDGSEYTNRSRIFKSNVEAKSHSCVD